MKLNFKTHGQGEPLIILHGLLGSLDNWSTLAKKFAENYTVFIVDQRNHGKSPHAKEFNYQVLSEDLLEFMDDNHIYSANILGHSMGGKTAMNFAVNNPDRVQKLIIADIAPIKYDGGHQLIFDALFSINLNEIKSRKEVDKQLEIFIKEFGIRQFLMKGLTRDKDKNFVWKFNLKDIWNSYSKIINTFDDSEAEFDGETLFVKGANSNYILDEYSPKIEEIFPNYTLETIEDAGHWLHSEKPAVFFKMVSNFLHN
jgi:pimeloyl-ACP methyl ester carboxylesterase